jgi:asparagine synthase (glutamine-hydrolysing)
VAGFFGIIDLAPAPSPNRNSSALLECMARAMRYDAHTTTTFICRPTLGVYLGYVGESETNRTTEPLPDASAAVIVGHPETDEVSTPEGLPIAAIGPSAPHVWCAYQRLKEDAIGSTPGIFSGVIVDAARRRTVVFTDRYGMERVFVYRTPSRVFFASAAKAILAGAPETRRFDSTGLAEWLSCGTTLGSRSLFAAIDVVPGGTLLTIDEAGLSSRRYFDPASLEELSQAAPADFVQGFAESLRAAVNRLVTHHPSAAVSLTGGLDSRMIMASLDAPSGSVPCYTFSSPYRTTADVALGRRVAALAGQPHVELRLGDDFLRSIGQTLEQAVYVSDGYMGMAGAAELYLNRCAREIAPARVTGNWGGELMRGVRAFKYQQLRGDFVAPSIVSAAAQSAALFAQAASTSPLSFVLFHQMPLQGYGRLAIERSQVEMRAPFLADDVIRWLYQAPAATRAAEETVKAVVGRRPELLDVPTDTGRLGTDGALPSALRRASRRLVVKAEYLTSHGAPDWLAAVSAALPSGLLETRFLGRDKFHHFKLWIRHQLAGFVRESVHDTGTADLGEFFDMHRVRRMVDDHIGGRRNYTDEIDKVITVVLARRTLLAPLS